MTDTLCFTLPAAWFLDLLIGDPHFRHHPVRYMGKAIERLEPRFRRLPFGLTLSGGLMAVLLISGAWAGTAAFVETARLLHPAAAAVLEILIFYFCIASRGLADAAMTVYRPLRTGRLEPAKERLTMIVGRDVRPLSEEGTARAAVETVAENLVDGVISPLFFAALGGAPMIVAYKMVNTLDSMVGYKNAQYRDFGKIAARIDDAANYLPARLSVPVIALASQFLGGNGKRAFRTALAEGRNHASPNAGFPEAAFAGALGVKLGGPNVYHGEVVPKPYIGERFGAVKLVDIVRACDLMILSAFLWLVVVWGISLFL